MEYNLVHFRKIKTDIKVLCFIKILHFQLSKFQSQTNYNNALNPLSVQTISPNFLQDNCEIIQSQTKIKRKKKEKQLQNNTYHKVSKASLEGVYVWVVAKRRPCLEVWYSFDNLWKEVMLAQQ